ncbi:MAG: sugar kinase [Alphaproteobacteria bacterium]|nr:sugar kinase [Alphaproteobacteria bacterium]MBU1525522.1 sugar kinase [Alphaproteobacteria bacterium]MBU2117146.1 sugar kinase [Alphaproteobacteria bacterium]MBU2350924.1 sugar kinase [Alphaproteobacteria bacterium]MBU2383091.1 sugar kinase [Alphaproteobacteria bacterium]
MTATPLSPRSADACRWDLAALGEVMLRLDPGEGRVRTARRFDVWEGGGEYNVARALAKGFGRRTTAVTALPRNDLGLLVDDLMAQGGVDRSHVVWRDFDGVGRDTRVGLNFTERGFGVRPARGTSDRANSAASQLAPEEVDGTRLFGTEGVRWFHTGGIFAALSDASARTALAAVAAAKASGAVVSYDLNYRASLWAAHADPEAARRVSREIARHVDVMIGDAWGFRECLGLDVDGAADLETAARAYAAQFPDVRIVAATRRKADTAGRNDWSAQAWSDGQLVTSVQRPGLDVLDRVGGGDGFVAGLAHALLEGQDLQTAVEWGAAHGALAMTTPGDTSMVDASEVAALVAGADARSVR